MRTTETTATRKNDFLIYKKQIEELNTIIKEAKQEGKQAKETDKKSTCIGLIFKASNIRSAIITQAKINYPAINWASHAK
jgi:hypothetical protein